MELGLLCAEAVEGLVESLVCLLEALAGGQELRDELGALLVEVGDLALDGVAVVAGQVPGVHLLVGDGELLADRALAGQIDARDHLLAFLRERLEGEGHHKRGGPLAHARSSFLAMGSHRPRREARGIIAPAAAKSKRKWPPGCGARLTGRCR